MLPTYLLIWTIEIILFWMFWPRFRRVVRLTRGSIVESCYNVPLYLLRLQDEEAYFEHHARVRIAADKCLLENDHQGLVDLGRSLRAGWVRSSLCWYLTRMARREPHLEVYFRTVFREFNWPDGVGYYDYFIACDERGMLCAA